MADAGYQARARKRFTRPLSESMGAEQVLP